MKKINTDVVGSSSQEILDRLHVGVRYITSNDQVINAIDTIYQGHPETILGLDIETAKLNGFEENKAAGLNPHLSRIRLIQLCTGREVFIFDIDAIDLISLELLWHLPMVAHNAVFELKHLIHAGITPPEIDCTMLMANAISGTLPSLETLVQNHFGWTISKDLQTSDWNSPDLSKEQLAYAALDAVLAYRLYYDIMENMKRSQLQIYLLMRETQIAVAKLELNGFDFDMVGHVMLMADWEQKKTLAEQGVRQLLGHEINLSSPKQLSSWLGNNLDAGTSKTWPKTGKGQLSTDADTLAQYSDHPLVTPLLTYREIAKLLSTYGEAFSSHLNPVTERIHANFRISGAATGRFTCTSPNIQNMPRDKAFRSLFAAAPGKILIVGDYNQIELRVAAILSRDPVLLAAYEQGEDLHQKTASAISGIPMDRVTKEQRQAAKAVNFGLLYGQGATGLRQYAKSAYGVNMTEGEATNARNSFFKIYPRLAAWQKGHATHVHAITPTGRYRDLRSETRDYHYTEALNTPIQGGAAEVLLAALPILDKELEGIDAKLVNIVHDEVVVEASIEHVGQALEAVENSMIQSMLTIFPEACITNLVEMKIGDNWGEGK